MTPSQRNEAICSLDPDCNSEYASFTFSKFCFFLQFYFHCIRTFCFGTECSSSTAAFTRSPSPTLQSLPSYTLCAFTLSLRNLLWNRPPRCRRQRWSLTWLGVGARDVRGGRHRAGHCRQVTRRSERRVVVQGSQFLQKDHTHTQARRQPFRVGGGHVRYTRPSIRSSDWTKAKSHRHDTGPCQNYDT